MSFLARHLEHAIVIVLVPVIFAALALVFQYSWNAFCPDVFGLPRIGFGKSVAALLLIAIARPWHSHGRAKK